MVSVRLNGVSKRFGKIRALSEVNMAVETPGCIGILGPNGAGKTTMLKILTNVLRPDRGTAEINGISVSEFPAKALSHVGALVEEPEFYPYLTGREILSFVIRIRDRSIDVKSEINRVSRLTSIAPYLDRKSGGFSKGMKQRLGVAVALACNPEILILDEPTFGLDPAGMKDMRDLVADLKAGNDKIILLSTHLIYEAQELCDRIVIIDSGKIQHDTLGEHTNQIKIELEKAEAAPKPPANLVADWRVNGATIVARKADGITNSEVISFLLSSGSRVKWVTPYNDLEDTYIRITKGSPENKLY